jgi:hypothetical protein
MELIEQEGKAAGKKARRLAKSYEAEHHWSESGG